MRNAIRAVLYLLILAATSAFGVGFGNYLSATIGPLGQMGWGLLGLLIGVLGIYKLDKKIPDLGWFPAPPEDKGRIQQDAIDVSFKEVVVSKQLAQMAALAMEYEEAAPAFQMVWPNLPGLRRAANGEFQGYQYTHRVFRIRIRNVQGDKTLRNVRVKMTDIRGIETDSDSVLHDHDLRVMGRRPDQTGPVDIDPMSFEYFDVLYQDLDQRPSELGQYVDELGFRYAAGDKPPVSTDPGWWLDFSLLVSATDTPAEVGRFRAHVDDKNVAHLSLAPPKVVDGVEPIVGRSAPYCESDVADAGLEESGLVYRVGLRSADQHTHVVRAYVESVEGGLTGVTALNRALRFKDHGSDVQAAIAPGTGPTAFLEVMKRQTGGRTSFLYAQPLGYREDLRITGPFSLRIRLVGGGSRILTLHFLASFYVRVAAYTIEQG